ncbi:CRE-CUTL-3 protein [Caenorhabditis remanei]|uniref:CRE-CUTL-3 protein n=1 Tax=Caenorhabditis remanei TaxID=31234 RepID=E3MC94_CAERE|nr:CRE-CUTL-3 protein [Caenorhabditis remanei]
MFHYLTTTLTVLLICKYRAEQIDNGLQEDPQIRCGSESLSINFKTQGAFEGHVYVKGHYSMKQCRTDATLEPKVNLTVSYSACDVIRQRSSNPKGIMMTATIIISFHPMFITKIDKSYKVQCFYAESQKTVTQQLNVDIAKEQEKKIFVMVGDEESDGDNQTSGDRKILHKLNDPSTEERINYNVPLPDCKYRVLNEGKNEEVAFATVGQIVYHEWSCEAPGQNQTSPFCVTVHSCNVKDETGKEVQIFDENGCAVDKYLINNLEYSSDLTGGQLSQVFKFADQPSVFFQCKIRLGLKDEDGSCTRSSDHCPVTLRGKRSTTTGENDFDVISQTMTILDIDEPSKSHKKTSELQFSKLFAATDVCVSPTTASGIVVFVSSLLLVCLISSCLLCFRHQTVKVKLAP